MSKACCRVYNAPARAPFPSNPSCPISFIRQKPRHAEPETGALDVHVLYCVTRRWSNLAIHQVVLCLEPVSPVIPQRTSPAQPGIVCSFFLLRLRQSPVRYRLEVVSFPGALLSRFPVLCTCSILTAPPVHHESSPFVINPARPDPSDQMGRRSYVPVA